MPFLAINICHFSEIWKRMLGYQFYSYEFIVTNCLYFVEPPCGKGTFLNISGMSRKPSDWGWYFLICQGQWIRRRETRRDAYWTCFDQRKWWQCVFLALAKISEEVLQWLLTVEVEVLLGSWQVQKSDVMIMKECLVSCPLLQAEILS